MKLTSISIAGFRGYLEEVTVDMEDFCVLIGRNDAGKSTVLSALRHPNSVLGIHEVIPAHDQ